MHEFVHSSITFNKNILPLVYNPKMFVDLLIGDIVLPKKAKMVLCMTGERHPCVSGAHASKILQTAGHAISSCDVYNYMSPSRCTGKLKKRWPDNVQIERLT